MPVAFCVIGNSFPVPQKATLGAHSRVWKHVAYATALGA